MKVMTPTPEQLKSLNLRPGKNEIKFTVTQHKQEVSANIYFWNYDTRIVVSDIDGTIT